MRCRLCSQVVRVQPTLRDVFTLRPLVVNRLCQQCQLRFQYADEAQLCPECGAVSTGYCADCRDWLKNNGEQIHCHGIYRYNDAMRDLIHQYKFGGDYRLRDCFRGDIARLKEHRFVFVPLTTERAHFHERGFDTVLGLFGELALQEWLVKDATAQPQSQKDRAGRLATPQSFRCIAPERPLQRARTICLVDDLYTTGRTIRHAAAVLRVSGFTGTITARTLIR